MKDKGSPFIPITPIDGKLIISYSTCAVYHPHHAIVYQDIFPYAPVTNAFKVRLSNYARCTVDLR